MGITVEKWDISFRRTGLLLKGLTNNNLLTIDDDDMKGDEE